MYVVRNIGIILKESKIEFRSIQEILEDWMRLQGFLLIEKKNFGTIIVSTILF